MNSAAQMDPGKPPEHPPPKGRLWLFERALLEFYRQVDICRLKRRHLNCLRTIRKRSFDLGRPMTDEIDLNFFVEDNCFPASTFDPTVKALKFDKAEASRGIDELERVLHAIAAPKSRRGRYGINVLWSAWIVTLKNDSVRPAQGLFDLPEHELDEQLRKDFIEFGGCPPDMPQELGAVPTSCSGSTRPGGDCNATRQRASGAAAEDQGGGVPRCDSLGRPIVPASAKPTMGGVPHDEAPGARSVGIIPTAGVGIIPTAETPGARSVGIIPTMPLEADKHWSKSVGIIPTAPKNGAEMGAEAVASLFPPCTPLVPVQRVQKEQGVQVQIIPDQLPKGVVPARARARRSVGIIPTAKLSWAEQRRLLEVIEGWTGAEDVRMNYKFWVLRVIRNFAWEVDLSVASLREQERLQPDYFQDQGHKIKVLVVDLAKRCGVKSWREVPPGPAPIG